MPITIQTPGIAIPSGDANAIDLATAQYVANILAAGGVAISGAQLAAMPGLITSASREMQRWMGRLIPVTSYVEVIRPEGTRQDRGEAASAKLTGFPIVDATSVSTGLATALTVRNTSGSVQRATVKFVTTGDVELPTLVPTGLALTRVASGVTTTNTLLFADYATVAALATAINLLGNGWSATATAGGSPDLSLFPSAWLTGCRETRDARNGASLSIYATPLDGYSLDRPTGILYCNGWGWGHPDDWAFEGSGSSYGYGYGAGPLIEVRYTAGFSTIPHDLQLVVAEMIRVTFNRLKDTGLYKSQSGGNQNESWSWTVKESMASLSAESLGTLGRYKAWSV